MRERLLTFARLASAFPTSRGHDLELTIDTYVKATMDVPVRWLEAAVAKLIRSQGTGFLPTIGRVLQVVATEGRAIHRRACGQHPTNGDRGPLHDVEEKNVEVYLSRIRAWEGLPALAAPATSLIALPMEVEKRVRDLINRPRPPAEPPIEFVSESGKVRDGRRPTTHDQPF